MGMLQEFKDFAMKGNVVDMAVGVVTGAAFGAIVSSLVADVIMPPVGVLIGGIDFSSLAVTLQEAHGDVKAVTLNYGKFLNTIINFLIVAFAIFMAVKVLSSMKKSEAAAPPPPPPKEELLLTEIRDILKNQIGR
jgi:large conductance mechanosensitive channel